jgi:hypothetical protein
MAVWFVQDFHSMTTAQAAEVIRLLDLGGKPPAGQILHVEGPIGSGTRVCDVWESEEAFGQFVQEKLLPAFQQAGVQVPENLRPEFLPATIILK